MSHFPRHAEYKNSGNKWIGDIPSHWHVTRYKNLMRERGELSKTGNETLMSVSAYTGVTTRAAILEEGEIHTRADSLVGYKKCAPDDLVVNIMLAWNRGLGFSKQHGIVSPAYCVFKKTNSFDSRFLNYLVRDDTSTSYYKSFSTGLMDSRLRLYPETLLALQCALPNIDEQGQIADFLDRETTRIDSLIEKKTRFIELLKEKRQAVITNAVTKGLDPSVPMTESEIEWIGQTPKHWNIKKLKWSIKGCFNGVWGDEPNGINDLIVVRVADFNRHNRTVDLSNHTIRSIEPSARSNRVLQKNDLLIEKSGGGDNQPVGMVVIYDSEKPAVCSNFVARMPVAEGFDPYFINYLHQAIYATRLQIKSIKQSTGIQNLDSSSYLDELAPYPPFLEQIAIREFLISKCGRFDALLNKTNRSIELLREHRSALITAAVTGKIDVRISK